MKFADLGTSLFVKEHLTMNPDEVNPELLNRISGLRSQEFPDILLDDSGCQLMEDASVVLKDSNAIARSVLKKWIHSMSGSPPYELIWKLNEEGVMFVTTYFNLRPQEIDRFCDVFRAVYAQLSDSPGKSSACQIIASIIVTFVNTLTNYDGKLQTFFKWATCHIIETAIKMFDEKSMKGCYLIDVLNSVYVFQTCLNLFALLNLKTLLSYTDDATSPNEILQSHKKWTSSNLDAGTSFFISKLLEIVEPKTAVAELKSAPNLCPFRCKYFLAVLSILLSEKSVDAAHLIKGLIDGWLKKGLEDTSSREFLYLAIVSARHCGAEKTKQFPSYIAWLGSAQPTNAMQFVLFFKFLADLVPYEPPLYLKIHLNKVPTAPSGCQNVLSDYITLAKTRLADLNETTDYLSIFNECYDTDEESLSADVAQLLIHFEATNEIAKPVLEASVFRRQYYEKIFLKYLLRVPASEDPLRSRLIRKMNSAGKIPTNLFTTWNSL